MAWRVRCSCSLLMSNSLRPVLNSHLLIPKALPKHFSSEPTKKSPLWKFLPKSRQDFDTDSVSTGRPWTKDELRAKSNVDIVKIWYIVLVERNLVLTVLNASRPPSMPPQSPERIFKLEETMRNILDVVDERNDAYNLLEYGDVVDRKPYLVRNELGLVVTKKPTEQIVPKELANQLNPEEAGRFTPVYRTPSKKLLEAHKRVEERKALAYKKKLSDVKLLQRELMEKDRSLTKEEAYQRAKKLIVNKYADPWEYSMPDFPLINSPLQIQK